MDREKVIDRARKLLALGQSENEHEAALAVSRAQALLEEHDIAMADLGGDPTEEPMVQESYRTAEGNRATMWRVWLVQALAEANGCAVYRSGAVVFVCGRRDHAQRVLVLAAAVAAEVDRFGVAASRGQGRAFGDSFRKGAVQEIRRMLAAERAATRTRMAERGASSKALTVVDNAHRAADAWMRSQVVGLRRRGSSSGPSSGAGFRAGREAGRAAYGAATRGRIGGTSARLGSGR